jgi:hypothetical protein
MIEGMLIFLNSPKDGKTESPEVLQK